MNQLIGAGLLKSLAANDYTDEHFGEVTVRDILKELEKPGRDPRPEFKTASFKEGVETLQDLETGMILEGVITNVTNFGAFVDIGVHQDGLVHISALSETFVKDPRDVVKTGQVVKVKVMEIDLPRKRIGLSMRLTDETARENNPGKSDNAKSKSATKQHNQKHKHSKAKTKSDQPVNSAMAQAFARLKY